MEDVYRIRWRACILNSLCVMMALRKRKRSASVPWKKTTHMESQKLLMRQRGAGGSSGGVPPDLLGKDEVASSNLASSSKALKLLEFRGFFLFLGKLSDRILFRHFRWKDAVYLCVQKSIFLDNSMKQSRIHVYCFRQYDFVSKILGAATRRPPTGYVLHGKLQFNGELL